MSAIVTSKRTRERAYQAGRRCRKRCVSSHTYGLGHQHPDTESAFADGYNGRDFQG